MTITYPGETQDYRTAREALLAEEIALRAQVERVAACRRALPMGGPVPQDYTFVDLNGTARTLSDLFTHASSTLGIYSLMFRPDQDAPCPMCSSMLDGLNAQVSHIAQHMDLVVIAAATPEQLRALSESRNWSSLTLLSAGGTTYQQDYNAQTPDGAQLPMMNVFCKTPEGACHFWGSEMFFADLDGHPRHVDQLWPLWNLLDMTPGGRGGDWFPALRYGD